MIDDEWFRRAATDAQAAEIQAHRRDVEHRSADVLAQEHARQVDDLIERARMELVQVIGNVFDKLHKSALNKAEKVPSRSLFSTARGWPFSLVSADNDRELPFGGAYSGVVLNNRTWWILVTGDLALDATMSKKIFRCRPYDFAAQIFSSRYIEPNTDPDMVSVRTFPVREAISPQVYENASREALYSTTVALLRIIARNGIEP